MDGQLTITSRRWEQLIVSGDLGGLIDVMLCTTQVGIDMRSVSPDANLVNARLLRNRLTEIRDERVQKGKASD